ncbi:hypothetical protein SB751_35775, partial [Cupriavidus sp. SIMBA_020]|uniref:hypothetical protein n=1 Tax=Cupriavidus sp. SIMBA_020 TaxID=3085766 RepID=UPI00397CB1C9
GEVRLFTLSVLAFTIASALCGLASNFETLIAFRLLQGLVFFGRLVFEVRQAEQAAQHAQHLPAGARVAECAHDAVEA